MPDLTAKRTIVKSPPELWSELSELERLAKHLDAFGEIRITRLEPEHTVAWEGDNARGTVSIEPSGWGTKVTLTARLEEPEGVGGPAEEAAPLPIREAAQVALEAGPAEEVEPVEEPQAVAEPQPEPASMPEPDSEPDSEPDPEPEPEPEPPEAALGFFARLFRRRRPIPPDPPAEGQADEPAEPPAAEREPVGPEPIEPPVALEPEPEPDPEPAAGADETGVGAPLDSEDAQAVLEDTLEALGSAHHRPFSRG